MGKTNSFNEVNGYNGVDLTGTRIRSVSTGASGCKKIAVFSGSGRVSISCDNSITTSDNLIQQAFPKSAWGRKFLTVPTSKLPNNYYRVAVNDPSTVVTINGVKATNLINQFYYEFMSNTPVSIVADKPIMVAQYITSTNISNAIPTCGNSFNANGDPEMIYLSPVEQTIDKITLNSTSHHNITTHYINVVIKSSAISSFTLDGVSSPAAFATHPRDAAYSYAVFTVTKGNHTLKADSGFNAIAYGYGPTESYGYNAGTNIKDLYQYLSIQNKYSVVDYPATCSNSKFSFFITLPYQPTAMLWDFGNNSHIFPNQNVNNNSPVPDSSFIRDGRTLYVYKLPTLYTFDATGSYTVRLLLNNNSADGCSGQQEVIYNVTVNSPPQTDFTISHSGCATTTTSFIDASSGNGRPLVNWMWDFGDGTMEASKNANKVFGKGGAYNIKHTAINDIGCATDTTKTFAIDPAPEAKFGVSGNICSNSLITFIDSSKIASGNIAKWHWNFGNGDSLTTSNNSVVSKTYNSAGDYIVSLSVENANGCKSSVFRKTVTISPSPIVNFEMPGVCLPTGIANFTNLSTISNGTVNDLSYVWNFGDGTTSTDKNPKHTYTSGGAVDVKLTATSNIGCSKDTTKRLSNIYSQPRAAFSYNPASLCVSDSIRFTDNSVADNNSVKSWFWKFSDGTTSTLQNPVKKFRDSGNYTISLYTQSAAGCNSDTITKAITINQIPTAGFSISGSACQGAPFTINDASRANAGVLRNRYYYFDTDPILRTDANSFTYTYNIQGNHTIKLVVESDKGCKSDTAKQTIIVKTAPVANFILPEICVNDPAAAFKDSSYVAGNPTSLLNYKWNFGDANATAANPDTAIVRNPSHKYFVAGLYNVRLTVNEVSSSCTSTISKTLIVSGMPVADFSFVKTLGVCGNEEVQIKNASNVNPGKIIKMEIIWDSENNPAVINSYNNPVSGTIYSHLYGSKSVATIYKVKLRAYSGINCFEEKVLPITVNASPKVVFLPVSDFCITDNPRMITEAKETAGNTGGVESFSGAGISPNGLFDPRLAGEGSKTIRYTYTSSSGCTDTTTQIIRVVPNPTISLPAKLYVLQGASIQINPTITGNPTRFIWSPSTYLNSSTVRSPVSTPKDSITYRLTASNGNCSNYAEVSVVVLEDPNIPTAFSPNGDGINDQWFIQSLSSYPTCVVEVFDRYGRIVFKSRGYSKPWDGSYNGSIVPLGVYYYVISPGNGKKSYTGNVTILK
jgi:gliding motility-associated-like protein